MNTNRKTEKGLDKETAKEKSTKNQWHLIFRLGTNTF
jgi:hypothetical protein